MRNQSDHYCWWRVRRVRRVRRVKNPPQENMNSRYLKVGIYSQ